MYLQAKFQGVSEKGEKRVDVSAENAKLRGNMQGRKNRTDNVDVGILPLTERSSRLNGDALLTFQIHAVHLGTNTIFSTNIMDGFDTSSVKQNTLSQGSLATKERKRKDMD